MKLAHGCISIPVFLVYINALSYLNKMSNSIAFLLSGIWFKYDIHPNTVVCAK
jgi:hypothetical protein